MILHCHCLLSATATSCTKSKYAIKPFSVKISVFSHVQLKLKSKTKVTAQVALGGIWQLCCFSCWPRMHHSPWQSATDSTAFEPPRSLSSFRRSRVGSLYSGHAPRLGLMCEVWTGQGSRGTRRASGPQRSTLTRGRRGEATLWFFSVLRLSNEALLIQIRVNDYLIIPILQRAPSPSVLCSVDVQRTNPESVPRHETVACCTRSGQTSNMNKSYMFQGDTAITRDCFKSAQTAGICFIYF